MEVPKERGCVSVGGSETGWCEFVFAQIFGRRESAAGSMTQIPFYCQINLLGDAKCKLQL